MWISTIELINFKSYIHQKLAFPRPHEGRNLVLIGGMNGFGKTTLLEAIYLCLYGQDAVPHLARAGLHSDAYGKFIKKALHGKAISNGHHVMMVEIELSFAEGAGYQISRRWYFNSLGNFDDEEVKIYKIHDGSHMPLPKEDLIEILDNYAVPAHLAPFFFFDGEEVKKLADQDRSEWVQQGMENLLGVVLLRGLQKRLEEYQNNKKPSGKISMDEAKLDELYKLLRTQEEDLEGLRKDHATCNDQRGSAAELRDEIHQRLSAIGAGGGGVKQFHNILRDLGENEDKLNKCNIELERILSEKLPFHLINHQVIETLKKQLKEEEGLLEWENSRKSVEPQKSRFTDMFFSMEFTRPLNQQTKNKLLYLFNEQLKHC